MARRTAVRLVCLNKEGYPSDPVLVAGAQRTLDDPRVRRAVELVGPFLGHRPELCMEPTCPLCAELFGG